MLSRMLLPSVTALWLAASGLAAQETTAGALKISAPWMRTPPGGAKVASGYVTITNMGNAPDRLVGGSTAIAERVEVHEMTMDKGIMKMRALNPGLDIAPGQTIELKPGSYHLMMMGLKAPPPEAGKPVQVELRFEKAGAVTLSFDVQPLSGAAKGPHKGH